MTDLPFVSALVQADLPVWEQCLQTEFLQKMENGTLSEDCFKSYLVEDSLYLREYAKIFCMGHDQGHHHGGYAHLLFPAVLRAGK